jgi:predicted transcriptional regulator
MPDLEKLAKHFPSRWLAKDQAVAEMSHILKAPPGDQAVAEGLLQSLVAYGLVERRGTEYRQTPAKHKPRRLTETERFLLHTTEFTPFT